MATDSVKADMGIDEVLARAADIGSATWADAVDELVGLPCVCSGLTQRSGQVRCIGFAATATAEVAELGTFATSDFGLDRMLNSARAGEVLAVNMGGAEVSTMGGIGALAARNRKIAGVLIDGGCRDVADIQSSGLWVASRHVTPRTGKRRVKLGSFGAPTSLGGVPVNQGDLIVADATGIVVVPARHLAQVMELAQKIHLSDTRKEVALRAGRSLEEARAAA